MSIQQYLGVYSPKNVEVIVAGLTIDGLGEEMIEVERLDPEDFKARVGPKGDVSFIENLNRAGKIKISVKQNAGNAQKYLRALSSARSVFAVQIVSKSSYQELVNATTCVVSVSPRKNFKADEQDRVWEILAAQVIEQDN